MKDNSNIKLKKCTICNKVVKAMLYKKGKLYEEYVCLENTPEFQKGEYHVFKVKTKSLIAIEVIEGKALPTAGGILLYESFKKEPSGEIIESSDLGEIDYSEFSSFLADRASNLPDSIPLFDLDSLADILASS